MDSSGYKSPQEIQAWINSQKRVPPKMVSADLLDRLKGYAVHDDDCNVNSWTGDGSCTCGLTEVLKEL